MTTDHRITPGLVHDIVDALERHGYYRSDDLHADRAIGLIGDLACIYEGTQDHPAYPGPTRHDAITLTATTPAPSSPRRISPLATSATAPGCAPTSPTSRAPPARSASGTPRPSTRCPAACSRPPRPPPPLQPASPRRIAGPSPPPTGRPASDVRPPQTG